MSGYSGRNRAAANGGPRGVQISYASQLKEREPLFNTYEHLQGLERGDAALTMLRKIASMVKPIMRKRNWKVQILAEFLPPEQNLLGLNINRGYKICVRLRFHNNPHLFLPMEQVLDTLLHELSHNVWGPHDANFHRLWDELRDEQETLMRKGYTGEGFLTEGKRLGGRTAPPPPHEMRRLARASAEKRHAQNKLSKGSGQRLGGNPLHLGTDVRNVIANQITRRNTINKGCGSGRADAVKISDEASNNTFKTKAEEDDANNRAINQALFDLIEEEEQRKLQGTFAAAPTNGGLAWDPATGLYDPNFERPPNANGNHQQHPSEAEQMEWALQDSMPNDSRDFNQSNLFDQQRQRDYNSAEFAPLPAPLEWRPSPVSAPASRASSVRSPVSPPSQPASIHGSIRRKHVPTPSSTSASASTSIPRTTAPAPTPPIPTPTPAESPLMDLSEPFDPTSAPLDSDQWTCPICTCINPLQFLACDACTSERPQNFGRRNRASQLPPTAATPTVVGRSGNVPPPPPPPAPIQPQSLGWICSSCGAFHEHRWWTCTVCGKLKDSS